MRKFLAMGLAGIVSLGAFPGMAAARYRDGMNLYSYVQQSPATNRDPEGSKILISCQARQAFVGMLSGIHNVIGYELKQGNPFDEYSGPGAHFFTVGVHSEIPWRMIQSKRVFKIAGVTSEDVLRHWTSHYNARFNIIRAADTVNFGFQGSGITTDRILWAREDETVNGEVQTRSWARYGDTFTAVEDLWKNGKDYGMGCRAGARIVVVRGISQEMTAGPFNRLMKWRNPFGPDSDFLIRVDTNVEDENDWVPGDWGAITNTKFSGKPGHEGENVIYMGGMAWWGHTNKPPSRRPLTGKGSWFDFVESWDGGAKIENYRRIPRKGLW